MCVLSKESLRFQYTLEQGYDSSCGMSVVATALDLYWGVPTDEDELIETALGEKLEDGDYTVSLADMAGAFESRGVAARAFRLDWDGLVGMAAKGYAPIVVHYDEPEKHFALLLGFKDGRAVTVDPARGLESLSREAFEARYSGTAMALASRTLEADAVLVAEAIETAAGRQRRLEEAAAMTAVSGRRW
ncbi:MAG TPA: cysteine peptidase family C39 domain-containing protein [Spirochaetales bacterium]|nr:cysteine peptidase family C39 domain-containing protein [Spirochaetales bacterium]